MVHDVAIDKLMEKLLLRVITGKKRKIFLALGSNKFNLCSTTQTVKFVAKEIDCAESTVWENIAFLKSFGMINCNGTIKLTQIGNHCIQMIDGGINEK